MGSHIYGNYNGQVDQEERVMVKVKLIGASVELDFGEYSTMQPNPVAVSIKKHFTVKKHEVVAGKPLTQPMQDKSNWDMSVTVETTSIAFKNKIDQLDIGPYVLIVSPFAYAVYLEDIDISQGAGPEFSYQWKFSFTEKHDVPGEQGSMGDSPMSGAGP